MGKKSRRFGKRGFIQHINQSLKPKRVRGLQNSTGGDERVRELRQQIEIDLCNAVTQGYLDSEGVFLAYRQEHMPELAAAAALYQAENPRDSVHYLGWDGENYVVQIAPDLQWLFQIRNTVPNLTFKRISTAADPVPD